MATCFMGVTMPDGTAQLVRFGVGVTQLVTGGTPAPLAFDVTPTAQAPAGESGVNVFRGVEITLEASDSYTFGVTPIIDGVALQEQQFAGVGSGVFVISAPCAVRGTRATARLRTLTANGALAVLSAQVSYAVLRFAPG